MSVYYLIDSHTNPTLSSEINDVIDSRTDLLSSGNPAAVVNGNFVVRVADDQRLEQDPTSLGDLLTQKYTGLRTKYGLTNEVHDALLDASQIVPQSFYKFGERGVVGSLEGNLLTALTPLASTPSTVVVIFEFFRWRYLNPKNGRLLRVYEEVPPSEQPTALLSTDGGVNYVSIDSNIAVIPPDIAGSSLQLNISDVGYNSDIMLGSWAALY